LYNLDLVRQLCKNIGEEKDPERIAELAELLQAIIKEDQDEIRLRLRFLAKVYPPMLEFNPE
jgi:hypothetical protein